MAENGWRVDRTGRRDKGAALRDSGFFEAMMLQKLKITLIFLSFLVAAMPVGIPAQGPYPGQPAPAQPMGPPAQPMGPPPQQVPGPQQQPSEYAFRPDLTNPEFGECLQLEKAWQAAWQRYAQEYQRVRWMNPRDPQYAQMTYYLRNLKQQLDATWQNFSGRCVYFPGVEKPNRKKTR
ncbi:MAG: hypothetical protein M1378_03990 [Bacteroidetes bacterium]|nr:hypothetical protein [Bacteroidota bacterium]